MSWAKKQPVSSPHDSNRDSSCLSQFICRAMDDACMCVRFTLKVQVHSTHDGVFNQESFW